MGTESFPKKGQVSKKKHVAKGQGKEYYQNKYDPAPTLGGGPDGIDRRFFRKYRKQALTGNTESDF
jgi:hypothetical protein